MQSSTDNDREASLLEKAHVYLGSLLDRARVRLVLWCPQLTTLFVGLGLLPVLLLFSAAAGWIVYTSTPNEWSLPLYLQFGDGPAPYAELDITGLASNQPYDISLHLVVPANGQNLELGNFMASLSLRTPYNMTVLDVRRPSIVHEPFTFLPQFIFGKPRHTTLNIMMAESFVTGAKKLKAYVELGRRDGWRSLGAGQGRELSVQSATLDGTVRPQGLRYLVAMFPMTAGAVTTAFFFTISCLVLFIMLIPSALRSMPQSVVKDIVKREDNSSDVEPASAVRPRRTSVFSAEIKEEDED